MKCRILLSIVRTFCM